MSVTAQAARNVRCASECLLRAYKKEIHNFLYVTYSEKQSTDTAAATGNVPEMPVCERLSLSERR
jgi:hypothetical protein